MKHSLLLFILIALLSSCTKYSNTGIHEGLAPIYTYINLDDQTLIKAEDPREFNNLGGIVERGKYIYILEKNLGIHVIDNSDPNNPINIKFWSIPGINLYTLDATRLYADNGKNLWIIDITDTNNIKLIDFEENVFENSGNQRPPEDYEGYFECVDRSKGIVIGWETKELNNPQCRTINF